MPQIIDENSEVHPPEYAAPAYSTAHSAAKVPDGLPFLLAEANAVLHAHLQVLTERPRGYVAVASAANTRRACAAD